MEGQPTRAAGLPTEDEVRHHHHERKNDDDCAHDAISVDTVDSAFCLIR